MMSNSSQLQNQITVSLGQARQLIETLAEEQSVLLLSQPGVGKSDIVAAAAANAGLPLRSLLGTQIAPEDVSGIPKIEGDRSVFCPPRVLLPEDGKPFCLFLDELPATSPDVQKAFYSLLLERRIGEFPLPEGTWVVAAGNRVEDQSLVRLMSAALINRVTILHVVADHKEWFRWAADNEIRQDILAFLAMMPTALVRESPRVPAPFSTPRSWARLSRSVDRAEAAGLDSPDLIRALAFGTVSPEDAAIYAEVSAHKIEVVPVADYLFGKVKLPTDQIAVWFAIRSIREVLGNESNEGRREIWENARTPTGRAQINQFLMALSPELRSALLVWQVGIWKQLGAEKALVATLREMVGLEN